jgi:hypothetical protein
MSATRRSARKHHSAARREGVTVAHQAQRDVRLAVLLSIVKRRD